MCIRVLSVNRGGVGANHTQNQINLMSKAHSHSPQSQLTVETPHKCSSINQAELSSPAADYPPRPLPASPPPNRKELTPKNNKSSGHVGVDGRLDKRKTGLKGAIQLHVCGKPQCSIMQLILTVRRGGQGAARVEGLVG